VIQVFQQLAFPGVPDLRAGTADIGHGQQVQGRQPARVADPDGEGGDDRGVADVFFLRGARHHQMHVHQPGDQLAVRLVELVLSAEPACIDGTQFGMVAAASLGNVVEQGGQVEQLGLVERGDQAAGKREFVRQIRHGEAPHVAQHGENVFVDRVDVEEVVLHLPDDAAECRDVATEQAIAMHRTQRPGDADRLAQQRHEQGAMQRVGAKCGIDARAAAPQCAQRRRFETGQRRVLGIDDEGAQQGIRFALEQVGCTRFEQIGTQLEIGVDRFGRRGHREQTYAQ